MSPGLASLIRSTPGIDWIVATGRGFASAVRTPVASCTSQRALHVFDGGATIASFDRHEISRVSLTRRELRVARSLIDATRVKYIYASVGLSGGIVWASDETDMGSILVSYRTSSEKAFWKEIYQRKVSKLTLRQKHRFEVRTWCTRNEDHIDITRRGTNKATGAREVFQACRLDPADAIFIFNDENDLPVLKMPFFKDLALLKVGGRLPNVQSHFHVRDPNDVAAVLRDIGLGTDRLGATERPNVFHDHRELL
jgi:hydroxymethylpyrimidine pyrophosphatase-like HAD family hydrolase